MTGKDLLKAIRTGKPVRAPGGAEVTAVDYHVQINTSGEITPYAGVIDRKGRYRSIALDQISVTWDPGRIPSIVPAWNASLKPEELRRMLREGTRVSAGGRHYRRVVGLYVKKEGSGKLICSAACLDRNGKSIVHEPVRMLRRDPA